MTQPLHSVPVDAPEGTDVAVEELSFEAFFREEHPRLYRSLCLVAGSREEADEITQEAFLKVWERWDRVSMMDDPTGYLFRVAMNTLRSRYRSALRAMRRTVSAKPPDDAFAEIEDRDVVIRALRELTPQQRAAVVLTNLVGYSSDEAGRILAMKPSTVRTLSTRARAAIRETVGERP